MNVDRNLRAVFSAASDMCHFSIVDVIDDLIHGSTCGSFKRFILASIFGHTVTHLFPTLAWNRSEAIGLLCYDHMTSNGIPEMVSIPILVSLDLPKMRSKGESVTVRVVGKASLPQVVDNYGEEFYLGSSGYMSSPARETPFIYQRGNARVKVQSLGTALSNTEIYVGADRYLAEIIGGV